MMKYSLNINKGIWHISFYITDNSGKRKQKQLSTGIKALNENLKSLKARQDVTPREIKAYMEFVCVNDVGTLITPDTVTAQFRKLLDKNGLPHIKFHALRHSCISLLANNTAFSMKQIQDYAGHGDFLTTIPVPNSNTKPKQYLPAIISISKKIFSRPYARNLHHFFRRQHHIMNNQYKEQRKTLGRKAE